MYATDIAAVVRFIRRVSGRPIPRRSAVPAAVVVVAIGPAVVVTPDASRYVRVPRRTA